MENPETVTIVDVDRYRGDAQYHHDVEMLDGWLTLLKSALAEQGVSWPDSEGVIRRVIQKLSEAGKENDRRRQEAWMHAFTSNKEVLRVREEFGDEAGANLAAHIAGKTAKGV